MIDKDIRGGRFDQRIVIERLPDPALPDSFGQTVYGPAAPQGDWFQVVECWSHIGPLWGQELRQSAKELAETWFTIQVRYGVGKQIQPSMRLRHKSLGTLYDIRTVMHVDAARRLTELTCLLIG